MWTSAVFKVATPEGVVRDSSDGDDGNSIDASSSSSDDDGDGLDTPEQARRAAQRHCGWVPSTSNGVEVRCMPCHVLRRFLAHTVVMN